MNFLRSPSIVQLILIAFVAIALPLIWAIVTTLYQVDTLVEKNANVIVKVKKESVMSRELADQLTSLERSARQYQVLGDENIQAVYVDHRSLFESLLNQLIISGPSENKLKMAIELREKESMLFELVKIKPTKEELISTDRVIVDLHSGVGELLKETDQSLSEKTDTLTLQAQALKQQLVGQALLVLPITFALAILFTLLITRPIRQLSSSIHALGQGDLTHDIVIRGPHDIKTLSVSLNRLRKKLHEVDQQKEGFLRNMSHELKTPLASIREGAELLYVGGDPGSQEEQGEIIDIVKSSSIHLQKLIEGLLHFSELTASHGDQHLIQLSDFFESVIAPYQLSLRQKKITVKRSINIKHVYFNFHSLKLIVDNLLSNAIKFSPDNETITITVSQEKLNLSIIVEDNGRGVSHEEKDKIFELFYKNEKNMSSPLSSSGLGLAIVKEIVMRAHGKIELYSHLSAKNNDRKGIGGNTQFVVLLPISQTPKVTIDPQGV